MLKLLFIITPGVGFGSIGKKHDENLLLSVSPAFKNGRIRAENLTYFFALEKSLWCFLFRLSG